MLILIQWMFVNILWIFSMCMNLKPQAWDKFRMANYAVFPNAAFWDSTSIRTSIIKDTPFSRKFGRVYCTSSFLYTSETRFVDVGPLCVHYQRWWNCGGRTRWKPFTIVSQKLIDQRAIWPPNYHWNVPMSSFLFKWEIFIINYPITRKLFNSIMTPIEMPCAHQCVHEIFHCCWILQINKKESLYKWYHNNQMKQQNKLVPKWTKNAFRT